MGTNSNLRFFAQVKEPKHYRLVLGSTAYKVLTTIKCPIFVIQETVAKSARRRKQEMPLHLCLRLNLGSFCIDTAADAREHGMKHFWGEAARLRIVAAAMVAIDQG